MHRYRLCVCYIITTFLITMFVYALISSNIQNAKKLLRMREELDEMAGASVDKKADSNHLTDLIDSLVKKRISGIWDDLYSIKKQIKAQDCHTISPYVIMESNKSEALTEFNRANYASEELGARILNVKAEALCPSNFVKYLLGMEFAANPPVRMLRSNMDPGSCFAFKNNHAQVTIKLSQKIKVDRIGIQHINKKQSPSDDISSAPRDISVYGIKEIECHLGTFVYDIHSDKQLQTFPINAEEEFEQLRFHFDSNHGNPNYTCIYRVIVNGRI